MATKTRVQIEGTVRTIVPVIQGVVAPDQLRYGQAEYAEVAGNVLFSRSSPEDVYVDVGAKVLRPLQRTSQEYGPCTHKKVEAERPLT